MRTLGPHTASAQVRLLVGKLAALMLAAAALLAASAPLAIGQAPGAPSDDAPLGQRIVEARCAACHGANGNSTDPRYPKLAGQNPAYLYRQLWAFKTGARPSEVMAGIASLLSDADIAAVTDFYSRQTVHPDTVKDARLADRGRRIFFAGEGPGMAPPCAMCHGPRGGMPMMGMGGMMGGMPMMGMHGMMSSVPRLNGQHASYVVAQLDAFATGQRQGMMMNRIAFVLTDLDRQAVAAYVSALP